VRVKCDIATNISSAGCQHTACDECSFVATATPIVDTAASALAESVKSVQPSQPARALPGPDQVRERRSCIAWCFDSARAGRVAAHLDYLSKRCMCPVEDSVRTRFAGPYSSRARPLVFAWAQRDALRGATRLGKKIIRHALQPQAPPPATATHRRLDLTRYACGGASPARGRLK
jgi:hypothetical protein